MSVFKQCFLIGKTGFAHVGSLVCFASSLCVSCLGSKTLLFFSYLSQQQSPDTIPGPSAGPTVHKVGKSDAHGITHRGVIYVFIIIVLCFILSSVVMSSHHHLHKHTRTHTDGLKVPFSHK